MNANPSVADPKLSQQLSALTGAQRRLLELRLMKKSRREPKARQTITPRQLKTAPLSYNQQGLWLLDQLMPGESGYHTPTATRLKGMLNVEALRQALQGVINRHDALRTIFKTIDGEPIQVVKEIVLEAPRIDLTKKPENERESAALDILRHDVRRAFDLAEGPLIRAIIVRLREDEHILAVTTHHVVTDGWSVGIFQRELSALYEAYSNGRLSPLAELPIQYTDYALWQREWFEGEVYESQLAYWRRQFATMPQALELPVDHARPNVQTYRAFRGARQAITLPSNLTRRLKQLCQKENVTLFMLLMAAYQILLHRYTGEEDIVVGTPIAGRPVTETDALIGLFINTLALRANISGTTGVRDFLSQVKQVALGAYAHQDLAFERLVKELQPDRALAQNPLFQVMFVLQSEEAHSLQLSGLAAEPFSIDRPTANFDLTLDIIERKDDLVCRFESNADLFESETIARMMGHFQNLLEGIAQNPEQKISELPLLSEAERRQLLVEWNNTTTDYPSSQSIQELFEQQVAQSPDAVALVWDEQSLTYAELNTRANQLAHYLRRWGVEPDMRVAVCLQRSPELIIALLGILKAGGAYVPLDPGYPQARLEFMMKDAGAPLVVTQTSLLTNIDFAVAVAVCLDKLGDQFPAENKNNPAAINSADNLAYVMYTSGSTGEPKGVTVTHRNVARLVKNTNYASFSPDEIFLQCSTISFDASTFEIWGALLNGARLALLPAGTPSLKELGQAIKRHKVTTLWLTAGLFHLMVENHLDDLRGLRQLLAGGDVLSVPHVRKIFKELPNCRLINGYGPTENTTFSCCYPLHDLSKVNRSVPIGFPISNTSVYVLDRQLNPVPVGVPGELYLGGDGLARGYHDRPALTSERFVRNPFAAKGDRLYRTGDLVRYRATGEIEFIARIDHQVKVRGFRIELGEIEAALLDHHAVREAVVVTRKDSGDKHLAAYLVPRNGNLSHDEVREFLGRRLPDYMVPSVFVTLEALPLSPMGKVDRHALPAPDDSRPMSEQGLVAPADELELKLTRIWQRVLGVNRLGVTENFFELGGHSLLAVRLFAEIEKTFGKNLPLATLFQAPTVRQLASVLRQEGWHDGWSSLVMIQPGGARRPFFCVHAAGGNVLEYHDLARSLGPDQPFYGLQAKGLDGKSPPHTTIKEMAAHYIKEMREIQPDGPYLIGGRSSGGTIAFEMACQLEVEGEKVEVLALLDTYPAGYFKLLPGSATLRQRLVRRMKKWQKHVTNLHALDPIGKVRYLLGKLRYAPAKAKHKLYSGAYKILKKFGNPLPAVLQNIEEINFIAVKEYEPQIYSGDITLFLASDLTSDYDLRDGWRELVRGRIDAHEIPGNHLNIIKEPHVRELAEKLRLCLT
jgi:amino acid adenylation domain-containing protein